MTECSLARTIGAPARIGIDGRVTGNVDHKRAALVAGGGGECPEQGLRQPECPEHVDGQRLLQVFALRVGKRCKRRGTETRGAVDEDIETAEICGNLQGDWIDIVLAPDVA